MSKLDCMKVAMHICVKSMHKKYSNRIFNSETFPFLAIFVFFFHFFFEITASNKTANLVSWLKPPWKIRLHARTRMCSLYSVNGSNKYAELVMDQVIVRHMDVFRFTFLSLPFSLRLKINRMQNSVVIFNDNRIKLTSWMEKWAQNQGDWRNLVHFFQFFLRLNITNPIRATQLHQYLFLHKNWFWFFTLSFSFILQWALSVCSSVII